MTLRSPIGWRYGSGPEAAAKRDLRLDLLRGWCVVVMVIDHIGGEHSWLYAFTGGNRFFVSAAEGFVLVSGVTMGMVYGAIVAREGVRAMLAKALARARTLYLLTVALTLVFAALSATLGSPWAREAAPGRPAEFLFGVVTLHRSYSLTDVLLLYTLLVLAAGPVLALFATGRTALALAASGALWGLWQIAPASAQLPWQIVDGGFPFPAWQAIFVSGLAVGYHRRAIARRVDAAAGRTLTLAAGLGIAAAVAAYASGLVVPPSLFGEGNLGALGAELFSKDDARIGRLVVLALAAILAYGGVTIAWRPARAALGWLLLPVGQRALPAYGVHLFVVMASATALAEPLRRAAADTGVQLAGVALVWLATPLVALAVERARALRPVASWRPSLVPRPATLGLASLLLLGACAPGTTLPWSTVPPTSASAVPIAEALPHPTGGAAASPDAVASPLAEPTAAQSEARVVSGRFASKVLAREMPYYVYVPPGYDDAATRYPVLYMLHGMGGSNIEWLGYGLARQAELLMRAGEIPPFLIVLPQGDESYWMDHANGGPRWGTYTATEVVAEIDARYRTLPDRRYRAIGGLSMGADGALQLALNHPDTFGIAGAHSPYLRREDEALAFFGRGRDYAARDPWTLALARPDVARRVALWIDIGDADERLGVTSAFHRALEDAGIRHAWRELIGSHSEEYWGGYAPQYLRYYAAVFCGLGDDPRIRRIEAAAGSDCPPFPHARR